MNALLAKLSALTTADVSTHLEATTASASLDMNWNTLAAIMTV